MSTRFAILPLLLVLACAPAARPIALGSSRSALVESTWARECAQHDVSDVLHHDVELSVELEPPAIEGHGRVRVRAHRTSSVVVLDARGMQVSSVTSAGQILRFRHESDQLCVQLPAALAEGAEQTLELAWSVDTRDTLLHWSSNQVWAGYHASSWLPTRFDPAQRATLALRIRAPEPLKVVASGRRLAPVSQDSSLVHGFMLERPSAPFLYAFAVGTFAEAERSVQGVTLRALGPSTADLDGALALTEPMLRFLIDRTGAAFPAAEYTQAFVHDDAAQEAAGFSLLAESALDNVKNDPMEDWIFAHELAHQWFAWLVPCADFSDFWLNEGFATFFVAALKEQRWGEAAYQREVALWRERSARVSAQGREAPVALSSPLEPPHSPPREVELQARGVTYSRGALVLHKLRGELGEAVFWAGIRGYVRENAGKPTRSEDLRRALEQASGLDLSDFFARWVYAAAPEL